MERGNGVEWRVVLGDSLRGMLYLTCRVLGSDGRCGRGRSAPLAHFLAQQVDIDFGWKQGANLRFLDLFSCFPSRSTGQLSVRLHESNQGDSSKFATVAHFRVPVLHRLQRENGAERQDDEMTTQ